jgi:hypothetical protein
MEADEVKQTFIYSEENRDISQNYVDDNLNTRCLEGKCFRSEIDVAVKQLTDVLSKAMHYFICSKGELSNRCKLQPPLGFSFKKGTNLEHCGKEPTTSLFALSLTL